MEYGLLGRKLSHSFSKVIHERISDYNYELKEIEPSELEEFFSKKEFKGINVTIPYKTEVIKYIDEISPRAKSIGAVNTVVNRNGVLFGDNTDYFGLEMLVKRVCKDVKNKKVLILGTGGTSFTAFSLMKDLGASEIYRVSRSEKTDAITYKEAEDKHSDADIIINTTPCGMYPDTEACPIDISAFENLCGIVDVIYNPLCSNLVYEGRKRGITAEGGLYMLVAQAVFASALFLEKEPDISLIDKIYKDIYNEKKNIVLIGMPASGKSTVGEELANVLSREFIDTDIVIEKNEGRAISEIFEIEGEEYFRQLETKLIKDELSHKNGCVIATGGGMILREENVRRLKQNGVLVFIDRPLRFLCPTKSRPLASNRQAIEKRYKERYPIYKKIGDFVLYPKPKIEDNVSILTEMLI